MTPSKPTDLRLISDEPVTTLAEDRLSLETFANTIASVALGTEGPFTIGVFGGWGHGKTSLLMLAKDMLDRQKRDDIATVWFNAWQYEKEEHPIVPLVATVIRSLEEKYAGRLKEQLGAGAQELIRALRAVAYGFSAKAKLRIPAVGEVEAGFVAKEMIDRDEALKKQSVDPLLDQSLYYNAFRLLGRLRGKGRQQPKCVVLVDDLDRCLPQNALHLLESMKLVLAQPGFVFVLAVHRQVIETYLDKRFQKYGLEAYRHGQSYLDKIIQLPLFLPPHQKRFDEFVARLLKDFVEADLAREFEPLKGIIGPACNYNPRELVRFFNRLLIDRHIWGQINPGEDFDAGAFAVARSLQMQSEASYRLLLLDDSLCKWIAGGEGTVAERLRELQDTVAEQKTERGQVVEGVFWSAGLDRAVGDLLGRFHLCDLLDSEPGQRWLGERDLREQIEEFLEVQREQPAETDSARIIDATIRTAINKPTGELTKQDRAGVMALGLAGQAVSDLSPLAGLTNLRTLDLNGTPVRDLSPLAGLKPLTELYLSTTQVRDLVPLAGLTNLINLDLSRTQVRDLSPLAGLKALERLSLMGTQVRDLSPLAGLKALEGLSLTESQVGDLCPLQGLPNLRRLYLTAGQVPNEQIETLKAAVPGIDVTLD
ncbi:MAG TPA: P-loop NTPase fold protein [Phycisphaerae bacterium]|nr:P-loop NTPase fold protein [Phycisphaerae bacterium]